MTRPTGRDCRCCGVFVKFGDEHERGLCWKCCCRKPHDAKSCESKRAESAFAG